jgi:HEAT repeat protein
MTIDELLKDKGLGAKERTETLSTWLLTHKINVGELISYAKDAKDSPKATCIEALEFATLQKPSLANKDVLEFVTQSLTEKAPRVKWESAKVIGNIAHLFPTKLDKAMDNLLLNSKHEGTVVRWSAAFALGEILKLKTNLNKKLLPAVESIVKWEMKNSIKKIYLKAIKQISK